MEKQIYRSEHDFEGKIFDFSPSKSCSLPRNSFRAIFERSEKEPVNMQ
ncbi:MAG: hypothetical protein U5L45_18755 [Saprospiraceae bacterium]|nr:hypothetical protein [Saprospiraceae bacterium]